MKDPLLLLAPSDLRLLSAAVGSGRLSTPYLATNLYRYVNSKVANEIATNLQEFSNSGFSPTALARMLELLADGLENRPPIEDLVDLVTTGPEGPRTVDPTDETG